MYYLLSKQEPSSHDTMNDLLDYMIGFEVTEYDIEGAVKVGFEGDYTYYKPAFIASMKHDRNRDNEEQKAYNNELATSKIGGVL